MLGGLAGVLYVVAAAAMIVGVSRTADGPGGNGWSGARLIGIGLALAMAVSLLYSDFGGFSRWLLAGLALIGGALAGAVLVRREAGLTRAQLLHVLQGAIGLACWCVAAGLVSMGGDLGPVAGVLLSVAAFCGTMTFGGALVLLARSRGWIDSAPVTLVSPMTGFLSAIAVVFVLAIACLVLPGFAVWLAMLAGLVLGALRAAQSADAALAALGALHGAGSALAVVAAGFLLGKLVLILAGGFAVAYGLRHARALAHASDLQLRRVAFLDGESV